MYIDVWFLIGAVKNKLNTLGRQPDVFDAKLTWSMKSVYVYK